MRHQRKRHKLGRNASHRKATLVALGNALIAHKRVTTTVPRAKALRTFIEPIITRAKDDSQHNRRQAFRHLRDKQSVTALFTEVAEKVGERPGGYTRVVRIGRRAGDAAPMAIVELVDYNETGGTTGDGSQKSSKRTRRGGRRSKSATPATTKQADEISAAEAPEYSGDEEVMHEKSAEEVKEVNETEVPSPEASDTESTTSDTEPEASDTESTTSDTELATSDTGPEASDTELATSDTGPEASEDKKNKPTGKASEASS